MLCRVSYRLLCCCAILLQVLFNVVPCVASPAVQFCCRTRHVLSKQAALWNSLMCF
jgi:hypothetical protein